MDEQKYGIDHTSVKVHQAPGGKSSFSFGWSDQPEAPKQGRKLITQAPPQEPVRNISKSNRPPAESTVQEGTRSGRSGEESKEAPKATTSVRVHAPPGGKSSIAF